MVIAPPNFERQEKTHTKCQVSEQSLYINFPSPLPTTKQAIYAIRNNILA